MLFSSVYNVDLYDGNVSSPSETQYEVKTSICHEIYVAKSIILILSSTYDKQTHMNSSAINSKKLKSFPHSLDTYF